uniref:aralkylamine N-acetyltransferase n=1 Tax=Parastrongyloides trichosuri TaxID=131310 RepID=A0A0N4ZAG6_PARTI
MSSRLLTFLLFLHLLSFGSTINSQQPICGKKMKDQIYRYCSTYICPEENSSILLMESITKTCCTRGCNEKEIQSFCCGSLITDADMTKSGSGVVYAYETKLPKQGKFLIPSDKESFIRISPLFGHNMDKIKNITWREVKSFSESIAKDSVDFISTKAKTFGASLDIVSSNVVEEGDESRDGKKTTLLDTIPIIHPNSSILSFIKAEEFDNKNIYDFLMDVFRIHEPITQNLDCQEIDLEDFFTDLASEYLIDNCSIVVFNEQKQLAGICLNSLHYIDPSKVDKNFNENYLKKDDFYEDYTKNPYRYDKAKKIDCFVSLLEKNYASILPSGIKKLLKIDIICVNPSYARLGIAKKLVELTEQFALQHQCDGIISCTTANGSRRLMEKKNFTPLRTLNFDDFKVNGEVVFQNLLDKGIGGALMFKRLSERDA